MIAKSSRAGCDPAGRRRAQREMMRGPPAPKASVRLQRPARPVRGDRPIRVGFVLGAGRRRVPRRDR